MDTQMINFVIPRKLLQAVDKLAQKELRSRSELLREAARKYIAEQAARKDDFTRIKTSVKKSRMSESKAMALIEEIRDSLPMNQ